GLPRNCRFALHPEATTASPDTVTPRVVVPATWACTPAQATMAARATTGMKNERFMEIPSVSLDAQVSPSNARPASPFRRVRALSLGERSAGALARRYLLSDAFFA